MFQTGLPVSEWDQDHVPGSGLAAGEGCAAELYCTVLYCTWCMSPCPRPRCTALYCTILYWEQVCVRSFPEQYPIQVRTSARVTHAVLTTSFWEEDTGTSTDYSSEHIIIWPSHLPILPLVPYPLSLRLCPENLQKESKMIQGSEIRQSLYTEIWMQQ